jgi:transposase-like protein
MRLGVLTYFRFQKSLCNVEHFLFERGIDLSCKMLRHWQNRFGPKFAG